MFLTIHPLYQFWFLLGYLAVKDYALENFSRWPILNEYVWPNPEFLLTETYDEQFEFVRYFLHERLLWMSKDIYN